MTGVIELQVLLDARGATPEEVATAAGTLLGSVPQLQVVRADEAQTALLTARFGERTPGLQLGTGRLRRDVPLLVAPGTAAYARGAVRRVLADLATPGRCLTCVLVPGQDVGPRVACWAPGWLSGYAGTLADLVEADLAFDREHLPAGSPVARSWLRADAVGVVPAAEVGAEGDAWSRRTGLRLDRDAVIASVRAPLGSARRRAARRRQRRAQAHRSR